MPRIKRCSRPFGKGSPQRSRRRFASQFSRGSPSLCRNIRVSSSVSASRNWEGGKGFTSCNERMVQSRGRILYNPRHLRLSLPIAGEVPLYQGEMETDLLFVSRNRLAEQITGGLSYPGDRKSTRLHSSHGA